MKLLISYGTRPEWLKIEPLLKYIECEFGLLYTGQHTSPEMMDGFTWDERRVIPECDRGTNRMSWIVSHLLDRPLPECTHVLVQGDTTSALAIALHAFHEEKKVIHLEAGLRTLDRENPYPEEINRQIISRIADYHLCPTKLNLDNLYKERMMSLAWVVGSIVLDPLVDIVPETHDEVLVTLHRRENHKDLPHWFATVEGLAQGLPKAKFTFVRHPNPAVTKCLDIFKQVEVVDPMPHEDLIAKLARCRVVITDSGGLQEEGCFLQKRIIVCRKITERPESVGTHSYICDSPGMLPHYFEMGWENYKTPADCPYGDGKSGQRIAEILKEIADE